jgi:Domain of unknown function (DUF4160)
MYFPPAEHGPPHVHVWKAGTEVIVMPDDVATPRGQTAMRTTDIAIARRLVRDNRDRLLQRWRDLHHDGT